MTGLFITFEGSEGCGKSTQLARLAKGLRQHDPSREVLTLREPGGTALGEKIRHLLQYAQEAAGMTSETELLLFAASRAQLISEAIRPALQRGAIVLCDRFIDSTMVYQGMARGIALEKIAAINEIATGGLVPHATILLDLEASVGRQRMEQRNQKGSLTDRMEQEPEAFYEAVRHGYLKLAELEPKRWIVIDASRSASKVAEEIFSQLKQWIS
ncbi:MAG: dTMP kinase [Chthoniobacterales bacterium]|nr:dTMP kinase [Chthoniobacterales bacterium]